MHPAPSVIIFTVLSGIGFGLLGFLGLGFPSVNGWVAFAFFAIAYLLAVGGLLASTLHLGNPQRALRAFTQWRTSWLSREGWFAVATLLIMAVYGAGLVFFETRLMALGWIGAVLSLATIYATSMIYGQLKTVPRWNHWTTSLLFLGYSLTGGALLSGNTTMATYLSAALGVVQFVYWTLGDKRFADRGHSQGTATGLGGLGDVRMLEPPHTGTNYLLKEMVYRIGRKHAQKLRVIGILLMSVVPFALLVTLDAGHLIGAVVVLLHLAGAFVTRWLFFAEAEHVVGLYYGK